MALDEKLVVLREASKEYPMGGRSVRALDGVNLELERGQFVAVVGASGSGKTTLLNVLGAMDQPTSGRVVVDGAELASLDESGLTEYRRHKVGFVFQNFNLIPNLTALENIMLPMELAGVPGAERRARSAALLQRVGMAHRARHKPAQLSGGEQQRVAIARALANDPAMILADEPTGNLDSKTGREIIELLRELARERGKTVVVSRTTRRPRPSRI
jgi:putative ABC transport system ATP-binding protein